MVREGKPLTQPIDDYDSKLAEKEFFLKPSLFAKNYVIVEPVTNKEGSFLNTETDITDVKPKNVPVHAKTLTP